MPAQTNHPLGKFKDGCISGHGPDARAIPLTDTNIKVAIRGGLASVAISRKFRNTEEESIEATITFPVPTDAVLTALAAKIGDRTLRGISKAKQTARATYEAALDDGKTTILHEEALRGIHIISVGHIPAGAEITVESRYVQALSFIDAEPRLRIPTTVGDVYGLSGLNDADELIHAPVSYSANLEVVCEDGEAHLGASPLHDGAARVSLDAPIDFTISGFTTKEVLGRSADGRIVRLSVGRAPQADAPINVEIVADRSGSMNERATGTHEALETKFDVMRRGMTAALQTLRANDRTSIWQFSNDHAHLGRAEGSAAISLVNKISPPGGGTHIGAVLQTLAASEARDVLLITDGKSHALDVQELARTGTRYTTVLIGEDALDAHLGYLASLTGGQIFVASDSTSGLAIMAALNSLRRAHVIPAPMEKAPDDLEVNRGGARIKIIWETGDRGIPVDDIGAYAAGLAIARMPEDLAREWALSHGLVTHLTSLVLVDDGGEQQAGLPATRKVPLSTPRTAVFSMAPIRAFCMEIPEPRQLQLRASRETTMDTPERMNLLARLLATSAQDSSGPNKKPRARSVAEALRRFRDLESGTEDPDVKPQQDTPSSASPEPVKTPEVLKLIDWGADPKALCQGNVAAIHPDAQIWVVDAAQNAAVQELSSEIGLSPIVLAVAIAAFIESTRSRQAARIYRAVIPQAFRARVEALVHQTNLVSLT